MPDDSDKRNPLAPYVPSDTPQTPSSGRSWGAFVLLLIFICSLLLALIFWGTSLL